MPKIIKNQKTGFLANFGFLKTKSCQKTTKPKTKLLKRKQQPNEIKIKCGKMSENRFLTCGNTGNIQLGSRIKTL